MKKRYLIYLFILSLQSICFCMEKPPSSHTNWIAKAAESYRYICSTNKLQKSDTITAELFEAIIKNDLQKASSILESCPEQMLPHILNNTSHHVPIPSDQRSEKQYPEKHAFFKRLRNHAIHWNSLHPATPLGIALYGGDQKMVELLLNYHAHPEAPCGQPSSNMIPLTVAVKYQPLFIPFLIKAGARPDGDTLHEPPLHGACTKEASFLSMKELIFAGSDVNIRLENTQCTPLMTATIQGHSQKVELLLKSGAKVDLVDDRRKTALHLSIQYEHPQITRLLLDSGADITLKTSDGQTIIQFLEKKSQDALAMELIRNGAPYPSSACHQTLIFNGCQNYLLSITHPFLKKYIPAIIEDTTHEALDAIDNAWGDTLNQTDHNGLTALHWAAIRGNETAVYRLLSTLTQTHNPVKNFLTHVPLITGYVQHPININLRDEKGRSALGWAKHLKYEAIAAALITLGAHKDS